MLALITLALVSYVAAQGGQKYGKSGFCGFGPSFCGSGNCTSNCNAQAECGQYAPPENKTCPLNVCCSQYGFCGQTSDFCETGCQSNCNPKSPAGTGNSGGVTKRRIGYYEGWAISSDNRKCDSYPPENIAVESLTHINFAFALISSSYQIVEMTPGDKDLWTRTTALKKRNSGLQVFLSIGGWTFNDPPTSHIFSNLVGSSANIETFRDSALSVMDAYGFDGIDIDWEYPAAYDRGGVPADKANYVKLMKSLKASFGHVYGLSWTAPSSYWYLQHFDIPGMLATTDFVNVMTYDLHGTWDGKDPWIGSYVLAHTNLTEIKTTLQLFQNVFTSADQWTQLNVGFGFYGRSFQLASSDCSTPGCPFSGPADAGPCTNNPGTLSFAEIGEIILRNDISPVMDEDAAVKYLVYNDDQWVSYDDAESFKLKVDYLDKIVGGSFVWSVDQDDVIYTAISALYPDVDVNDGSKTQNNQCYTTNCGDSCPDGFVFVAGLTTPAGKPSCPSNKRANLCCPSAAGPAHCAWYGGGKSTCNGQCGVGQITLALDPAGYDKWPVCTKGTQALCCDSGLEDPLDCYATECGASADNWPEGYYFQTWVKQGSKDDGKCEKNGDSGSAGLGSPFSDEPHAKTTCPTVCNKNNKPVFCASSDDAYTDCKWVGTVPACLDTECPVGYVSVFQDIQGDAKKTCSGKGKRSYCCQPPTSESFLPVPEDWVIPIGKAYGHSEQPASFTVDFDDNTGPSDPAGQGAGSTGIDDDGLEEDSPFGEVFITSPNSQAVSSLDPHADWVIVGCDAKSDQPQSVLAYCSMELNHEESGCSHVFIGGAQHTIVRMPKSCGAGPYSRIASFEEADDETVLPDEHAAALPTGGKVYKVSFDYEFDAIPQENGPVYMRADLTDMPGYWDEFINSAPDSSPTSKRELIAMKRNFHNPYDRRWFGGFKQWLNKLNTLTNSNSISRNFHWSDKYTIYHAEESCPNFESSLDISVTGQAQVNSEFGYYLEATVVPPAIQQAYVYVKAGASTSATFTMTGIAKAEWSSSQYELISFGFPGLHYPGLLTLGPSLHVYANLAGEISLTGKLQTTVGYAFPDINYALGSTTDSPEWGPKVAPAQNNNGFDYSFGYSVELQGGIDAYLTPSLEIGLSVLNGKVMDANVYIQADLSVGVGLNGSVSETQSPQICVQPHYGVNLHAGLKGQVVYWSTSVDYSFYDNTFNFGGVCYSSASFGKRDIPEALTYSAASGEMPQINHDPNRIAYSRWEKKSEPLVKRTDEPIAAVHEPILPPAVHDAPSLLSKRAGIPYLPGNLFCPEVADALNQTDSDGLDCICYSDASIEDVDNGQGVDITSKREVMLAYDEPTLGHAFDTAIGEESSFDNGTHSFLGRPKILESAPSKVCTEIKIQIPAYSATNIIGYYDHDNPGKLDPTIGSYITLPVDLGGSLTIPAGKKGKDQPAYAREHVYEQSLSSLFVDYLLGIEDLWQNKDGDAVFCDWAKENLDETPSYLAGDTMTYKIGQCYPGKTAGLTPNMAVLEQTANTKKNLLFQAGERKLVPTMNAVSIASPSTFKKYCAQKQVAVLRAAAGVPSFLNDYAIQEEFLKANLCVRNVWVAWYNAYKAATNVDAPNRGSTNANIPNIYDNFIHSVVAEIKPFLVTQVTNLIPLLQVQNKNGKRPAGPALIDISFYYLMDNVQLSNKAGTAVQIPSLTPYTSQVPVTQQDLTDQILNNIQDIALLSYLPTH